MRQQKTQLLAYLPSISVAVFAGMYLAAAVVYPGGSATDPHAASFSLRYNYWCDLLNEHAINGATNPARPIAITAMLILCCGLCLLWYNTVRSFGHRILRRTALTSGIIAFAAANLLFTPHHDAAINIASAAGLLSCILIFAGLAQQGKKKLFAGGIACVLMGAINYYIWAAQAGVAALPVLQKITFILMLAWCVWLNRNLAQERPILK